MPHPHKAYTPTKHANAGSEVSHHYPHRGSRSDLHLGRRHTSHSSGEKRTSSPHPGKSAVQVKLLSMEDIVEPSAVSLSPELYSSLQDAGMEVAHTSPRLVDIIAEQAARVVLRPVVLETVGSDAPRHEAPPFETSFVNIPPSTSPDAEVSSASAWRGSRAGLRPFSPSGSPLLLHHVDVGCLERERSAARGERPGCSEINLATAPLPITPQRLTKTQFVRASKPLPQGSTFLSKVVPGEERTEGTAKEHGSRSKAGDGAASKPPSLAEALFFPKEEAATAEAAASFKAEHACTVFRGGGRKGTETSGTVGQPKLTELLQTLATATVNGTATTTAMTEVIVPPYEEPPSPLCSLSSPSQVVTLCAEEMQRTTPSTSLMRRYDAADDASLHRCGEGPPDVALTPLHTSKVMMPPEVDSTACRPEEHTPVPTAPPERHRGVQETFSPLLMGGWEPPKYSSPPGRLHPNSSYGYSDSANTPESLGPRLSVSPFLEKDSRDSVAMMKEEESSGGRRFNSPTFTMATVAPPLPRDAGAHRPCRGIVEDDSSEFPTYTSSDDNIVKRESAPVAGEVTGEVVAPSGGKKREGPHSSSGAQGGALSCDGGWHTASQSNESLFAHHQRSVLEAFMTACKAAWLPPFPCSGLWHMKGYAALPEGGPPGTATEAIDEPELKVLFRLYCSSPSTSTADLLGDNFFTMQLARYDNWVHHLMFELLYVTLVALRAVSMLEMHTRRIMYMRRDLCMRDTIALFVLVAPPPRAPAVSTGSGIASAFRMALHALSGGGDEKDRPARKRSDRQSGLDAPQPAPPLSAQCVSESRPRTTGDARTLRRPHLMPFSSRSEGKGNAAAQIPANRPVPAFAAPRRDLPRAYEKTQYSGTHIANMTTAEPPKLTAHHVALAADPPRRKESTGPAQRQLPESGAPNEEPIADDVCSEDGGDGSGKASSSPAISTMSSWLPNLPRRPSRPVAVMRCSTTRSASEVVQAVPTNRTADSFPAARLLPRPGAGVSKQERTHRRTRDLVLADGRIQARESVGPVPRQQTEPRNADFVDLDDSAVLQLFAK